MKHLLLLILAGCLSPLLMSQNKKAFLELLEENQLQYSPPENFKEVKPKKNPDLYYNFALKHKNADFEIRYTIFPLKPLLKDYEESLKDSNRTVIDPNKYCRSMFMVNILNVSQSGMENMPATSDFEEEDVRGEFHADLGSTSFFQANSEFAKDYKLCMMVMLHKEDVADVYISFLGNSSDDIKEHMYAPFYALTFK